MKLNLWTASVIVAAAAVPALGGAPCPDTDGNMFIDAADLNTVLAQFGQSGDDLAGDINQSGTVNAGDLNVVLAHFGEACADPPLGACCLPDGQCVMTEPSACDGAFQGPGSTCLEADCQVVEEGCGAPSAGDCCTNNGTPACDDQACCEGVCATDAFCCDTSWDSLCADAAADMCGICQ